MTTLNAALSSAVSSLLVIEKQMSVASNNISNANTTGYTKETEAIAPSVTGGVGSGVFDLGTVSSVDKYMLQKVISTNTDQAAASTYSSYYDKLQNALGQISTNSTTGNDLSSQISALQSALSSLATSPTDGALANKVVSSLDNVTSTLRSLSSQVQTLRGNADSQISTTVDDINTQLDTIAKLNRKIAQAQAMGQTTAALSDQRNNALTTLSSDMGVNYFVDDRGMMQVYTKTGQSLVMDTTANDLSYSSGAISASQTYPGGGINGIMLGNQDITSAVSGTLGALVSMRDTELPKAQDALDSVARDLASSINSTYGLASSSTARLPTSSSLAGTNSTAFNGTDQLSVTPGTTLSVKTYNAAGVLTATTSVSLKAGTTAIDDGSANSVVSQLQAQLPGYSVGLNGSGQLTITSGTGDAVDLTTTSGSVSALTTNATATSFENYFSLPTSADLTGSQTLTGTTAVTVATGTTVRFALLDGSGNVSSYVDVPLSSGNVDDGTSGSLVSQINSAFASTSPAFAATASLDAAGNLVITPTGSPSQSVNLTTLSGSLSNGSPATGEDFASYFGMSTSTAQLLTGGTDTSPISAITISVRPDILNNANSLATGNGTMATMLADALSSSQSFNTSVTSAKVFPVSSLTTAINGSDGQPVTGTFTITGGSVPVSVSITSATGSTLQNIADAINQASAAAGSSVTATLAGNGSSEPIHLQISTGTSTSVGFSGVSGDVLSTLGIATSPSGYLGATSTSMSGYAASLISDIAARASAASSDETTKTATANAMLTTLQAQSGVNTDEEMAHLTTLQSAYASSAKIISTVQTMFNSLLQAVS